MNNCFRILRSCMDLETLNTWEREFSQIESASRSKLNYFRIIVPRQLFHPSFIKQMTYKIHIDTHPRSPVNRWWKTIAIWFSMNSSTMFATTSICPFSALIKTFLCPNTVFPSGSYLDVLNNRPIKSFCLFWSQLSSPSSS